jgi:low affinity Fe/Cu permease
MSEVISRTSMNVHPAAALGSASARFLMAAAQAARSQRTFTISLLLIAAWAVTNPLFHYSDTWQLAINTRTAVLRFFMVLLIQQTQNRASAAARTKLDELIRASQEARNVYVGLEKLSDESVGQLRKNYPVEARSEAHRVAR